MLAIVSFACMKRLHGLVSVLMNIGVVDNLSMLLWSFFYDNLVNL